jgi:hypothetical protein
MHPADHSLIEMKFIPKEEGQFLMHVLVGEKPFEAKCSPVPVIIRKSLA